MSSHVLVTYASSHSFLSSGQWRHVQNALLSHFPLRSIHWKPLSRPSVRTIQELDVKLVPFDSIRDELTSQVPSTLLEKPLLNLYIVHCEDSDAYRTTVRKQIKDWHAIINQRKNQEWIILQVNKAGAETAAGGFFQMKGSVLDKIRADFNVDKRDRCVQLTWSTGQDNPAAWADLISKVRDGILTAFDAAVSQREDEVKRSESQRLMPGWNFCTFFILKESLATSFEGMSLFEDALMQYDELDLSFNHVLRERNLSWFGTLIVAGPQDDSLPLLSIDKKSYRDLILANSITVFDFRIYLLARQCILLWRLGRLAEVCHSATSFLTSFGKRLRDVEVILPRFFIESWIYSSALSVVEQTESWAQGVTLENSGKQSFSAAKAELLELARHQLDIIGIGAGHLPSKPPFSMPLPAKGQEPSKRSSRQISKADILASIGDKEAFYDLYVALSNRAIESYAKAGRRKFALKLHGSLAALDVHRGRLSQALQTYSSLPAHYAPYKWSSLESYMLSRAIQTYDQGENAKDQQWINVTLSFLRSYVTDLGKDLLMQEGDNTVYVGHIVQSLRAAVRNIDTEFTEADHPAITIRIPNPNARLAESEDGLYLDISAENRLPCDIPINQIRLFLAGRESERLTFSSTTEILKSGTSTVMLFCPTASSGTFLVDSSEAWMSHLHFQWNHRDSPSSKKRSVRPRKAPTIVRLPRDLRAFDVRIRRPRSIKLGTPPTLLMAVSTGRNHISQAKFTLTSPSAIDFWISDAEIDSGSPGSLEAIGDSIVLSDIPEDASVSVLIPHSDVSALHAIHVNISVEYHTSSQPSITRTLWTTSRVPTSLPVAVNVQDFFRGDRLLSRFTISTTSYQHIRLASARLEAIGDGSNNVMISGAQPQQRRITTITPARPANFLFELKSKHGEVRDPLWLCIRYRMLRDEVESIIEESVDKVLSDLPGLQTQRSALIDHVVQALESDVEWVQIYGVTGQLQVPNTNAIQDEGLNDALRSVLETLGQTRHPDVDSGAWREIKIPVDVPLMNILAAARIQILHMPFSTEASSLSPSVYAGQPISALLTIETSCRWGPHANGDKKSYRMRFDVEEMVRDWLVSGRKRGDFEAKDGETYSAPITLIALHHGELPLPKVSVTALPLGGEMTMGSFSLPNAETYQVHGAEKVLVMPRGGRSTFVLGMGEGLD